jgi:acetylornithine deacetylase/succinyl-diaminopimelate desuccinylase-like protein
MEVSTKSVTDIINRERVISLLGDLVRIPSPYFYEKRIMDFVYGWLESRGIPVMFHRFAEDKVLNFEGINVTGTIDGDPAGPVILLNGHLDTVELCGGWTMDPYGCIVEGNRFYGLGACDMKGGCAALLIALEAFTAQKAPFSGKIVYSFVCDEEGPFGLGTNALIRDGIINGSMDVALITEPSSAFAGGTYPCICLGARGGWNYRVKVTGRSSHGASPELGINAVSEAARLLLELERTELPDHEKLGAGSMCCIDFEGGGAALSVPDRASFSIFRHVTIGEDKDSILLEVRDAVEKAALKGRVSVSFRKAPNPECDGFPAYVVDEGNPFVGVLKRSVKAAVGSEPAVGYFNSVGDYCYTGGLLGIPTLVFGPGGGNFHSADEYVELDTVESTAWAVLEFLNRVLGVR